MRKKGKIEKRIIAGLIDLSITAIISAILMFAAAGAFSKPAKTFEIVIPIVFFIYMLSMDLLHRGKSLGRILVKERVVGKNGKMPSTVDFIVRNIVKTMPVLVIFLFPGIRIITVVLAVIYIMVMFVRKDHLAIHDFISDTIVCAEAWEAVKNEADLAEEKRTREEQEQVMEEPCLDRKSPEAQGEEEPQMPEDREFEAMPQPGITGITGAYEEAFIPLNRELLFGRAYKCNIVFPEDTPCISRCHCTLSYDEAREAYCLTDLKSTYGTFLGDGSRIPSGEVMYLKAGEEFYLGQKERFRVGSRE